MWARGGVEELDRGKELEVGKDYFLLLLLRAGSIAREKQGAVSSSMIFMLCKRVLAC